jgi:UDP-N-acetylglucosamine 4,6-dehydratase
MTRFWIRLESGVELVLKGFARMRGGEIFVPKIPSVRMTDIAEAVAPDLPIREIGIRPGEKLHEVMCPRDIAHRTLEFHDHFVIQPTINLRDNPDYARNGLGEFGHAVSIDFEYNSENNPHFLSVDELRADYGCSTGRTRPALQPAIA